MSDTKLKPCPFCGGMPALSKRAKRQWFAGCRNSVCRMALVDTYNCTDSQKAIEAWNTRATDDPAAVLRELLESESAMGGAEFSEESEALMNQREAAREKARTALSAWEGKE